MQHIKTIATILATLTLAGCGTTPTHNDAIKYQPPQPQPTDTIVNMTTCTHEDGSTNHGHQHLCTWYGDAQGNGISDSYTLLDGHKQCTWLYNGADCVANDGHTLRYQWQGDGQCHHLTMTDLDY